MNQLKKRVIFQLINNGILLAKNLTLPANACLKLVNCSVAFLNLSLVNAAIVTNFCNSTPLNPALAPTCVKEVAKSASSFLDVPDAEAN